MRWFLVALMLASCDGGRDYEWILRFEDEDAASRASRVELRIREGGCSGEARFETSVTRMSGGRVTAEATPSPLSPGTYGFEGAAYDVDCGLVARGCVEITVPDAASPVEVTLTSQTDACDGACVDGACVLDVDGGVPREDGGAVDAGMDAGAPSDAGVDASLDAGAVTPDTGPLLPDPPAVVAPHDGAYTGALDADESLADDPLRPEVRWRASTGASAYVAEWLPCDERIAADCDFAGGVVVRAVVAGDTSRTRPPARLTVADEVPVGSRYAFRVGACADELGVSCAFGEARTLRVGRQRQDVDADGGGDLFMVSRDDAGDDRLYRSTTGMDRVAVPLAQTELGVVAWIGDYDDDARGELAVASGNGWLYLDDLAVAGSDTALAATRLGEHIVGVGDVDGDGYDDFAVSAPGRDEVRVQLGGATFDASRSVVILAPGMLMDFGDDLAFAGDRDGDGLPDLAVLSRLGPDTGRVEIYSLAERTARRIETHDLATGEAALPMGRIPLRLGRAVDMDDDGVPDLPIGRPLTDDLVVVFATETETYDDDAPFGSSVYGGDLDGTGRGRVAVGDPDRPGGLGMSGGVWHVRFLGGDFAVTRIGLFNSERFGQIVSVVDLDRDGREDMVSMGTAVFHVGRFSDGTVGNTAVFNFVPEERWTQISR